MNTRSINALICGLSFITSGLARLGMSLGMFYIVAGGSLVSYCTEESVYAGRDHFMMFAILVYVVPFACAIVGGVVAGTWLKTKRSI